MLAVATCDGDFNRSTQRVPNKSRSLPGTSFFSGEHRIVMELFRDQGKPLTISMEPTIDALKSSNASAGIQYSRWARPPASCT